VKKVEKRGRSKLFLEVTNSGGTKEKKLERVSGDEDTK
jgi:hypothetical protein